MPGYSPACWMHQHPIMVTEEPPLALRELPYAEAVAGGRLLHPPDCTKKRCLRTSGVSSPSTSLSTSISYFDAYSLTDTALRDHNNLEMMPNGRSQRKSMRCGRGLVRVVDHTEIATAVAHIQLLC